jgi:hypothetical protein
LPRPSWSLGGASDFTHVCRRDTLHRKPKTIQTHATRIYRKTGVTNRAQLAALFWARPNGVKRPSGTKRSNGIGVSPDRD